MEIRNPATDEVIKTLQDDTVDAVAQKFQKAKKAQPAWRQRSFADRAAIMRKFAAILEGNVEECARTLTAEVGKPLGQARGEAKGTLGRIEFFLKETEKRLATTTVFEEGGMQERIGFEPLGVIANVSAWNYPYFVGANVFVPALLTGNTVLYKPSEFATMTGLMIDKMLHEAGVPADVFQTIVGDGKIGAALLDQPVDGVFFTGSYATGKKIADKVAGKMVRLQLELGGKDPVYVRGDVDPKATAEGVADGAFYNTGQSCCAVERIYVHESLYDKFVDSFVAFAKAFKMGDPTEDGVYIGPLTRKAQLDVLDQQVADAVKKGAKVLTGGKRKGGKGAYFEPTVLVNVDHKMAVMREESFGPIIGIQKVKSDEEAVQLMNDTDYGLTAGVYTKDQKAAEALLGQINSGSVYWNCCDRVSPRLPWSGRGHSGIGSTLSTIGIDVFLKPKAWHLRRPS